MNILPEEHEAIVISKIDITPNIVEITARTDQDFKFEAGQFVFMNIPNTEPIIQRAYSMASAPFELPLMRFWIKFSSNSESEESIRAIKSGDIIKFKGPYGVFKYIMNSRPKLFIATSTGLAPIYSMLAEVNDSTQKKLIFGVRSEEDIFADELINKIKLEKEIDYAVSLSKPNPEWQGHKGRVIRLLESYPEDLSKFDFYICGSPPMVEDIKSTLLEKGAGLKTIHFEKFIGL